jgi:hypothetical protein
MIEATAERRIRVDVRLRRALEAGALPRDLLVVGPAGTGKTYGILAVLHCLLADFPGLRFLVVRQTRVSLNDSVLVTYEQEVLPADGMGTVAGGANRRSRSSYVYPNGSELVLGGMDDPNRIASTSWDLIYANEAIELNEEAWETLGSRLNRPGRRPWLGYLVGDTNPGDPAHWLKTRGDDGRTAHWSTLHEANPAMHDGRGWTEAGRAYLDRLDRLRGTRRRRFKDGVWAAGEGQWFDCFGERHVAERAEYDPRYPVHLAVDSGVHTGAVWFQVREGYRPGDTVVTVFGDYYAFDRPPFDIAGEILGRSKQLCRGRVDRGTTDPAGASMNATGVIVLAEYARAGLRLEGWPCGPVVDGLTLVNSFVAIEPPCLLVHPRCTDLITAFANYKRDRRSNQWIDRPKDPQHPYEELMDSLRGGLQDKFPDGRHGPSNLRWKPAPGGRFR